MESGILSHRIDVSPSERDTTEADDISVRVVRKQAYPKLTDASLTGDSHSVTGSPLTTSTSPLISFKPKLACTSIQSQQTSSSSFSEPLQAPHFGAVASLAIDGGLTTDQLMQIGSLSVAAPSPPICQSKPVFVRRVADTPKYRTEHQPFISRFSTPTTAVSSCWVQLHRFANPTHRGRSYEHVPGDATAGANLTSPFSPISSNRRYRQSTGDPIASHRQGSLPVQLNRVGGLIVTPSSQSSASVHPHQVTHSTGQQQVDTHRPSPLTACRSGDEDVTLGSSGTSYYSFSHSPPNLPGGKDAPHGLTPVVQSGADSSRAIVRLGPGDTVTHVASPASIRSNNIIRMHCSPRPYISSAVPETTPGRVATNASLEGCHAVATSAGAAEPGPASELNSAVAAAQSNEPPQRHSTPETDTLIYRQRAAISSAPMSLAMLTAKDLKPTSAPVAHVARTVRHLRRIRHIFGDSLNYSGTSASLGALGTSSGLHDRDFCSQCLTPLSTLAAATRSTTGKGNGAGVVADLGDPLTSAGITSRSRYYPNSDGNANRNHNSSCHSVEAARRPISLESQCSSCLSPDAPSMKETSVPIRFELANRFSRKGEVSPTTCHTPWGNSTLLVSPNGNLAVTRWADSRIVTSLSDEEPVPVPSSLSHFHVSNLTDNWIGWHPISQLASSPGLPSDLANGNLLVGLLRIPDEPLVVSCQLCFDTDSMASHPLHHWVPLPPPRPMGQTAVAHSPITCTKSGSPSSAVRGRSVADRSSSLGVAGPPGSSLMIKAMGTAAASVGMTLAGHAAYQSMLSQQHSDVSGQPYSVGDDEKWCDNASAAAPVNGIVGKTKVPHSKSPTRSTPGRLQLAFSRMRRATTVTSAGPASSSSQLVVFDNPSASTPSSSVVIDYQELNCEAVSGPSSCPAVVALTDDHSTALLETSALASQLQSLPASYVTVSRSIQNALPVLDGSATNAYSSPDKIATDHKFHVTSEDKDAIIEASRTNVDADYLGDAIHALRPVGKSHSRQAPSDSGMLGNVGALDTNLETAPGLRPCDFIPLPAPLTGPLPLHKCPRSTVSPFVPFVVELCVTLVEHFGFNCVGLYRLSGSKVAHDFISTELGKNLTDIDVNSDKWNDIHTVCGVLKTFLRNLPDSLLPKVMYSDFLTACRLPQRDRRLLSIQRLLSIMECYPQHPEYRAHRATLRYLATHLARVSARQALNKMTTYNLALVFAPNLVQPLEDRPELLMRDSNYKILLLETVIKYHSWIFSPDLGLESGCSIPPDSTEDLSTADLEVDSKSAPSETSVSATNLSEFDKGVSAGDDAVQPGRTEGNVHPLVSRLLFAAASLPPPPSDTDLETAEEPGPASDRPSDIASSMSPSSSRPRFVSIPNVSSSLVEGDQGRAVVMDQEVGRTTDSSAASAQPLLAQLGTKMDSLRHLSQGCLDQYTSEARQLSERVAKGRRDIETTVAQRLLVEQRLLEARSETSVVAVIPSVTPPHQQQPNYSATGDGVSSPCSPLVLASRQSPSGVRHQHSPVTIRPGPTGSLENIDMPTATKSSRD